MQPVGEPIASGMMALSHEVNQMARVIDKVVEEMRAGPPVLPPASPPEPPDPNRLTLEYLIRFEKVEFYRKENSEELYMVFIGERYGESPHFSFHASMSDYNKIKYLTVNLQYRGNAVRLYKPTIEYFHKAVEFLGATMPPLMSCANIGT